MTALELIKKALESREALYLVMDDPRSKRLLIAWTKYAAKCRDFPVTGKENAHMILAQLWGSVGAVDFSRLAELAGFPASRVHRLFLRLQAAHLLWPDGTISAGAFALISTEVGIRLSGVIAQARKAQGGRT